jgi:hypothetical protein
VAKTWALKMGVASTEPDQISAAKPANTRRPTGMPAIGLSFRSPSAIQGEQRSSKKGLRGFVYRL